jgi:hypothetical protein
MRARQSTLEALVYSLRQEPQSIRQMPVLEFDNGERLTEGPVVVQWIALGRRLRSGKVNTVHALQ